MIRTLRRAWHYFAAVLDGRLEQMIDPRIQLDQAIDEAKRRHAMLAEQAAAVRANERGIEIRVARSNEDAARLRESAGQALLLAARARSAGERDRAAQLERSARTLAARLTTVEAGAREFGMLLEPARAASARALRAVEQNALALQQQVTERSRLLTELEAAKMQERMAGAIAQMRELAPAGDMPSIASVRQRIDDRFATATARGELMSEDASAQLVDVRRAAIEVEGERRLEEIRASLGLAAPAEGEGAK